MVLPLISEFDSIHLVNYHIYLLHAIASAPALYASSSITVVLYSTSVLKQFHFTASQQCSRCLLQRITHMVAACAITCSTSCDDSKPTSKGLSQHSKSVLSLRKLSWRLGLERCPRSLEHDTRQLYLSNTNVFKSRVISLATAVKSGLISSSYARDVFIAPQKKWVVSWKTLP
jgi:hypothetical protein